MLRCKGLMITSHVFQDSEASYDYNSNDPDPAPRPTWNDENR